MSLDYRAFLAGKRRAWTGMGLDVSLDALPAGLYPFQAALTRWALKKGRAALWADTGLGKTRLQVAWANALPVDRALILAPLCVAPQTIAEAAKISVEVGAFGSGARIEITNYERLHHVDPADYQAVVLDESSILKSLDGKTRTKLIAMFRDTPYRLCCTATPAPNDIAELANHCEFLGVMTRMEMLATFFVHDDEGWRLKGHAAEAFYRWLASWGMFLRRPSDLGVGFSDDGYVLPPLTIRDVVVGDGARPPGEFLFHGMGLGGIQGRSAARRDSLKQRCDAAIRLVESTPGAWIVWTGLNDEQDAIAAALDGDAVSVAGKDSERVKQARLEAFIAGQVRVLVSKPSIAGFGLNLQHCSQMAFVGLGDSFETYYQALRRCYRFGQTRPVDAYVIVSEAETEIVTNVRRKEAEAATLSAELVAAMAEAEREEISMTVRQGDTYERAAWLGERWDLVRGDCVDVMAELPEASVDLSVFSPPFQSLYVYSASERDIGNCSTRAEFLDHLSHMTRGLLRITKPGRLACCHIAQVTTTKATHGVIGLTDLRGAVIEGFVRDGWIYQGEVCIDKDPQALRHGTPVLTPGGWKPIESFAVGDEAIGRDGRATKVVGVWPQGARPLYRVTFSDGVSIECDGRHLWTVRPMGRKWNRPAERQWITLRTEELHGRTHSPSGLARYELPLVEPVEYQPVTTEFPIDSYVLGVLLGDGSITQRAVEFMAEPEIAAMVNARLSDDCRVIRRPYGAKAGVGRYAITHPGWHENTVLDGLRQLGLYGQRAWEKHVPVVYARADVESRLALLRGLMDTDGTCKQNGAASYATVSQSLAESVCDLVRGFGGLAMVRVDDHPTYRYKGQVRHGRVRYIVAISMPVVPFSLPRKVARWHHQRAITRRIVGVERIGIAPCTCISVAAEDGLFVTDGHVVTHNSQAIRTHSKALLFVQLEKDASWLRPALADYVLVFRKPGDNAVAIHPDISREDWIEWARPIWYGIRESDTLNVAEGRADADDRHICPLQLGVIERCVRLWSNRDELVFSPFAGIGSEGYEALQQGRRFLGVELKPSYAETAVKNLRRAEQLVLAQGSLFPERREPPRG